MKQKYYSDIIEYNYKYLGRIGGNIPEALIPLVSKEYYFYATFPHPSKDGFMFSIFTPKSFELMNRHNIYPDCAIKVILHKFSIESSNQDFSNPDLSRMSISHYEELEKDYYSIREINQINFNKFGDDFDELEEPYHSIVIGKYPILIQDDESYIENLHKDGYQFFMQIDESGMPDGLIKKNYVFGYGALYLYSKCCNDNEEIIAGFWQN